MYNLDILWRHAEDTDTEYSEARLRILAILAVAIELRGLRRDLYSTNHPDRISVYPGSVEEPR
jgi:hypothetical protein